MRSNPSVNEENFEYQVLSPEGANLAEGTGSFSLFCGLIRAHCMGSESLAAGHAKTSVLNESLRTGEMALYVDAM
jgi:hypothetical protein